MTDTVASGQQYRSIIESLTYILERQREWSTKTFGPGDRFNGVMDHIEKELIEIRETPHAVGEWIDVVILALDGAWRQGHDPQTIAEALMLKYDRNRQRTWPDWRTMSEDQAIEHDRTVAE